jgi:hypothetical protein
MVVALITLVIARVAAGTPDGAKATPEQQSMSNAKQIVFACKVYAVDHNGNYPPYLDALFPTYLTDRKALISPLMPLMQVGYDYTPGFQDTSPPNLIVLEDKFAPKLKHIRIVVYTDDHVEILKLP